MLCNGGISPICQCWAYTLITMRSETALLHPGCIHMCVFVCVCSRQARWVVGIDHLHTQTHFHTKFSQWDVGQSFSVSLILPEPLLSLTRRSTALGLSLCGTGRRMDIWRICRGEWGSVLYWWSRKCLKPGSRGLMLIPWPFYQRLHFTLKLPLPCGSPLRSAVKFPPLGLKVIMAWYPPRMLNDRDIC